MVQEQILQKLQQLPQTPGVYIMKNAQGDIIYVGKAKRLKNRVKQYFDNSPKHVKVGMMAQNVANFDYILCETESDAFALENTLIKKHKPKYNILLKDDKGYPYIKITMKEKYPRVQVARKIVSDGSLYFGPYVVGMRVSEILDIVHMVFPLRTCSLQFEKPLHQKRMCLHGDIGNCLAPCVKQVSEEEYKKVIDGVIAFLNGKQGYVLEILEKKMMACAEAMDFENAILYRQKIEMLHKSNEKIITDLAGTQNADVFSMAVDDVLQVVAVRNVRAGKTVGLENFALDSAVHEEDTLSSFVAQYYTCKEELPKEIVLQEGNARALEDYIAQTFEKRVQVVVPQKGVKKQLVESTQRNAQEYLQKSKEHSAREYRLTTQALEELSSILNISPTIYRIEGYDISNIQGTHTVSSMVVFEGGMPAKKEYRKFKIKTVVGANDFACMKETLHRRLTKLLQKEKNFDKKPDLILIDGGLGQLHSAYENILQLGLQIPMVSLAKRDEEIYTVFSSTPIRLPKSSYALRLLQRVRDESHRFAITYHRTLRGKDYESELEKIPGIGKKRRIAIKKAFKTIDELIQADVLDFTSIEGISEKLALEMYKFLHPEV